MAAKKVQKPSGWTGISLQNFRLFNDTGVIRYAPVTLLFGKNSSGKTSILRSPLLVKQMLSSISRGEPSFVVDGADFGSFVETVYGGDFRREIVLTVEIHMGDDTHFGRRDYHHTVDKEVTKLFQRAVIEVTLKWNQKKSQTQYSQIRLMSEFGGIPLISMKRTGPGKFDLIFHGQRTRKISDELSLQSLRNLAVNSEEALFQDTQPAVPYFTFMLGHALEAIASKLVHIAPLRDRPNRAYQLDQLGVPAYRNTVDILQTSKVAQKVIDKSLRKLGMGSATLSKLAPGYVAITLTNSKTGSKHNIADVGFGVSQVLPIIASLASIEEGSTVLIEQPELHLHPAAQGDLADVLLDIGKSRNLTLVIETHSEHILLRLRRRVAEGVVPSGHVKAYFVDKGHVKEGKIDEFGLIPEGGMPAGFFEEEWHDLLKLTEAAAKRAR